MIIKVFDMFFLRVVILAVSFLSAGISLASPVDGIHFSIAIRDLGNIQNFASLEPHFSKEQIHSLKNLPFQTGNDFQLIKNDLGVFALTSCFFNVYQWTSEGWNNCYLYDNSGYNCGAKFFFRDGQLFSLGNYGFWRNHSDLLNFDCATGSWSFFTTENQPLDYGFLFSGVGDKGAFLFFGLEQNFRTRDHQEFDQAYFLNFENYSWQYLSFGNLISTTSKEADFVVHEDYLDTKDFMVFSAFSADRKIGFIIFDKNTLEFRFSRMEKAIELLKTASWILLEGNIATLSFSRNDVLSIDINDLYQKANHVGQAKILPISQRELEELQLDYVLLTLGILIATGLIVFWVLRREILKVKQQQLQRENAGIEPKIHKNSDQKLLELFEPFQGKLLTVEQLDQILLIDDIPNADHKKVKRSRLIKEVNQVSESYSGEALIIRRRNPEDKRFMIYEIQSTVFSTIN